VAQLGRIYAGSAGLSRFAPRVLGECGHRLRDVIDDIANAAVGVTAILMRAAPVACEPVVGRVEPTRVTGRGEGSDCSTPSRIEKRPAKRPGVCV